MQYQAVVLLVQGGAIAECDLIQAVYSDESYISGSKNLEKLIRKVRSKLTPLGLTIVDVEKCGYILLSIPEQRATVISQDR